MSDETKSVTITREANGNGARTEGVAKQEGSVRPASPFTMMRRWAEDMDRMFDDWQFGRGWLTPIFGDDPLSKRLEEFGKGMYLPDIEAFEKEGSFIVRADLPGMHKEDVMVDIAGNTLTIRGERKQQEKEVRKGYYRSERNYGSFYRNLPLPSGVDTEAVRASMNDGVLEIRMPLAQSNLRKVEID
jgi:HSP20 family protein